MTAYSVEGIQVLVHGDLEDGSRSLSNGRRLFRKGFSYAELLFLPRDAVGQRISDTVSNKPVNNTYIVE